MVLNEQVARIRQGSPAYPQALLAGLGSAAPAEFWAAGPLQPLNQPKTGFFCSSQCPGSVVLKTFDAITRMRDEGQILIGGFHSVMEWECLGILLRGRQPVIWVPARSIAGMHLKPELVPAFNAGRLLILSPFPPKDKRITATLAEVRNRLVGALADRIFVPHAAPGSRTLAICGQLRSSGKLILNTDEVLKERP
jgi:predicted Rossmann fold nucleotide-binding protein DprA/Smf involved in DNA uptake